MTKEELQDKIEHIVDSIQIGDKDVHEYKRLIKCAAHRLLKSNTAEAEDFLEYVNGVLNYHNFITKREYEQLIEMLKNNDGSSGIKYKNLETLKNTLIEQNKEFDKKPYFNFYSLALTMNSIMSDHKEVINKYIDNELIGDFCYDLAVSKNMDKDNPRWLRKYFGLE